MKTNQGIEMRTSLFHFFAPESASSIGHIFKQINVFLNESNGSIGSMLFFADDQETNFHLRVIINKQVRSIGTELQLFFYD